MQVLTRSLWKHPGLYLLLLSYTAYFGYFRAIYAFQRPTEEEYQTFGRQLPPQPRLEVLWKRFDRGFREFLKFQMYDNLFSNTWIDNRTGQALWDLTQVPQYQVLITDLFLLMYRQRGFQEDTERLTLRIVDDYLSSDFATKNMADLTVNSALRDTQHVLPGLQYQLVDYLQRDFAHVSKLAEGLLINVGWHAPVKTAFYAQLASQLRAGLDGSTVYDLAVANTVATLGAQPGPAPQEAA